MNGWHWFNSITRWEAAGSNSSGLASMCELLSNTRSGTYSTRWTDFSVVRFALITVLTSTCSFNVAGAGREQVRERCDRVCLGLRGLEQKKLHYLSLLSVAREVRCS
jgi:hypothetical protein